MTCRATFFMCGQERPPLPAIAREVAAAGHEIGNHTDSHPRFDFHRPNFIYREMALAQETIPPITGVTPRLFRAPYGVRWFGLRSAQRALGLTGRHVDRHRPRLAVAGRAHLAPAAEARRQRRHHLPARWPRACERAPDIRATLDAVEFVIPVLKERGFHFETVSQILCPTN